MVLTIVTKWYIVHMHDSYCQQPCTYVRMCEMFSYKQCHTLQPNKLVQYVYAVSLLVEVLVSSKKHAKWWSSQLFN